MRPRFSSLALVIVGAFAVRAAHFPSLAGERPGPWRHTLADLDLHVPALIVFVVAALDLLASYAPDPCALPRAVTGRREPVWLPLAARARALLDSRIAVAARPYAWLVGVALFIPAFLAFGGGGPGSLLAATSHLLLALLVMMRTPPLAYDVS
jgi:hypothetical protein